MRIIAGTFRGRPIRAPKGMTTRPTTDRVREAVFSILGPVAGKRVMDCYAGTGALGLEALSRGASHAIFVESGKEANLVIAQNIATLGVGDRSMLLRCPVERAHKALTQGVRLDLILADPPWPICHQAALDTTTLARQILKPEGVLVLGHPAADPSELPDSAGFELTDRRRWGDSGMSWYSLRAEATCQGAADG